MKLKCEFISVIFFSDVRRIKLVVIDEDYSGENEAF